MGWTFTHKQAGQSVRDFFQKEFERCRILDCYVHNLSVAYLACKSERTGDVFAMVCMLQYRPKDYCNFGYKDMDETMHPYYWDCPERILDILTPITHENALKWREACRKNSQEKKSKPKVKVGNTIVFKTPIHFKRGFEQSEFKVLDLRRRIFTDLDGKNQYRISRWKNHEYEVKQ